MIIILRKNNTKLQVTRCRVILSGFLDTDTSLNNKGLQKLKSNHAVISNLGARMSLKQLLTDLRLNSWIMNKSSFFAELGHEKQRFWSLTKITGPEGSGVTMRSALNTDPTTISGVPNTTFRFSFDLENGPASPLLPKGSAWCSTIDTSNPPVPIDEEWAWAFDSPRKK